MKSTMEIELEQYAKRAYGENEPPFKIAAIMQYEAGDVVRNSTRIDDFPDLEGIYKKQAQVSMGDVLAMAQLLCSKMGWSFQDLYEDGCQRAIDRCKEILEGKDGF